MHQEIKRRKTSCKRPRDKRERPELGVPLTHPTCSGTYQAMNVRACVVQKRTRRAWLYRTLFVTSMESILKAFQWLKIKEGDREIVSEPATFDHDAEKADISKRCDGETCKLSVQKLWIFFSFSVGLLSRVSSTGK